MKFLKKLYIKESISNNFNGFGDYLSIEIGNLLVKDTEIIVVNLEEKIPQYFVGVSQFQALELLPLGRLETRFDFLSLAPLQLQGQFAGPFCFLYQIPKLSRIIYIEKVSYSLQMMLLFQLKNVIISNTLISSFLFYNIVDQFLYPSLRCKGFIIHPIFFVFFFFYNNINILRINHIEFSLEFLTIFILQFKIYAAKKRIKKIGISILISPIFFAIQYKQRLNRTVNTKFLLLNQFQDIGFELVAKMQIFPILRFKNISDIQSIRIVMDHNSNIFALDRSGRRLELFDIVYALFLEEFLGRNIIFVQNSNLQKLIDLVQQIFRRFIQFFHQFDKVIFIFFIFCDMIYGLRFHTNLFQKVNCVSFYFLPCSEHLLLIFFKMLSHLYNLFEHSINFDRKYLQVWSLKFIYLSIYIQKKYLLNIERGVLNYKKVSKQVQFYQMNILAQKQEKDAIIQQKIQKKLELQALTIKKQENQEAKNQILHQIAQLKESQQRDKQNQKQLQNQAQHLEQTIDAIAKEINDLESTVEGLNHRICQLEKKINELKSNIDKINIEENKNSQQLIGFMNSFEELKRQLQVNDRQVKKLQKNLERLEERLKNTKNRKNKKKLQQRIKDIKAKLMDAKKTQKKSATKFSQVKKNIGRIEATLKNLGVNKTVYLQSEVSNSQDLKHSEGNLVQKHSRIRNQQASLGRKMVKKDKIEEQLNDKRNNMQEMDKILQAKKHKLREIDQVSKGIDKDIERTNQDIKQLNYQEIQIRESINRQVRRLQENIQLNRRSF